MHLFLLVHSIPHRRAGETDQAAMITMTYFHPWTLRIQDAEEHFVPHASNLRTQDVTWEDNGYMVNWQCHITRVSTLC